MRSLSVLVKLGIFGIGITPTLIGLLAAGILLGRPKACETVPCRPVAYGLEVLLLPIGTGVPFLCGYLLNLIPTSKQRKTSKDTPSTLRGLAEDA